MPPVLRNLGGPAGRAFILIGVLVLGFSAYRLYGTALSERRAQREFASQIQELLPTASEATVLDQNPPGDASDDGESPAEPGRGAEIEPAPPVPLAALVVEQGEPLGVLRIPAIDVEKVVIEGIGRDDLRDGPGHFPGSAMPGHPGNVAVAGHRTTYGAPFGDIDLLVPGDRIEIETKQGVFQYEVIPQAANQAQPGHMIVAPSDSFVVQDYGDSRLTLAACHPKYSAEQRIVVQAQLVGAPPRFQNLDVADDEPESGDADGGEAVAPDPVEDPVEHPAELAVEPGAGPVQGSSLDEALGWDSGSMLWASTWLVGLLLASAAVSKFASKLARGRKLLFYVGSSPVVLTVIWFFFVSLDRALPAF